MAAPATDAPSPARGRALAFGLTWVAYASSYLCRKGLSVTKARIEASLGVPVAALGAIETGYLAAYAFGQFASGMLGDRIGGRRLVGGGLLAVALACAWFGAAPTALAMSLAFALNGLAQSAGWPGNNKILQAWTRRSDRGTVMGLWSTCYQVGGLVATVLATVLLTLAGWRAAFYVPAAVVAIVGVAVLTLLPAPPPPAGETTAASAETAAAADGAKTRQRELARVLRSPTVWRYGAGYFCIKLIRYSLLFWLPYYLHTGLGYSEGAAGYLSTSFEVGGVLGAVGFGVISDRYPTVPRAVFAGVGLVGLALALLGYTQLARIGPAANFASMALVGALLFGPDALLSGAAAQDLGGSHATSTAAGVINGIGSLGAMLQAVVTVGVSRRYGWSALFWVFLALALLGAVLSLAGRRGRPPPSAAAPPGGP